jgi:glycosyltransferase involved in cell wall biosynthesis
MKRDSFEIKIIANWSQGRALSGGDRIFIELSRCWARLGVKVTLFVSKEGYKICQRVRLDEVSYIVWSSDRFNKFGVLLNYLARTLRSCYEALKCSLDSQNLIIYSSSDFWPDSLPVLIMRLRNKGVKWIAAFYLFAPKPWQRDSPYKGGKFLTGFFYWLTQLPIYWFIKRYADMIFVTSEPDREKFIKAGRRSEEVIVVQGGVDTSKATQYLTSGEIKEKEYDACFVGRFHPQKGVLELIDIWREVCNIKPDAKLAMIGIGDLEGEVKERIKRRELERNIDLLGFKDGEEKYEIFKRSKVILHPAVYDSGGMAAAEAMAWGLPGVSFDLEALKTYYPKGMLKVPCYNLKAFAEKVIKLLEDRELYKKTQREAIELAREWDWDKKSGEILKSIMRLFIEESKDGGG